MSLSAAFHRDDGSRNEPGVDSQWEVWVGPSKTRNFCEDDQLLDWLHAHGRVHGFVPDDERPGFDPRTEFRPFVFDRGNAFERAVCGYLEQRHQFEQMCADPRTESRTHAAVEKTWDAMCRGIEIIAQGVLWNPETQIYGCPDLLVRSDVLHRLFSDDISKEASQVPAVGLPIGPAHYRVVDVKFTKLDLSIDGHARASHLKYMVQVWLYNEALGRMQGLVPDAAYLLGRRWTQSKSRGTSALERLARVDRSHVLRGGMSLGAYSLSACEWVRRVRADGANWRVLPEPSIDELRPNLRVNNDQPWHLAKREIARQLADLTMLPRVNPDKRSQASAAGICRWTDPGCCAASLGITGEANPTVVDAVIEANRSSPDGPAVFPDCVRANEDLWRTPVRPEFYVDFETVSDLDDDFSTFPLAGGQPMIFMIGCGHFSGPAGQEVWQFRTFTAAALRAEHERQIIEDWLSYMQAVCDAARVSIDASRLFHWSPAETSNLTEAYNAAHIRHGEPPWPLLPWRDLLNRVVKAQPVTVRGAFGFGLKAIAKAMQRHGLIQTVWADGPTDGLGAMVGAWFCHNEGKTRGCTMNELALMQEIAQYNEVDCRAMAEVLGYLRKYR